MVYQIRPSYAGRPIDQNILRQIASGSIGGIELTAADHLTEFMRMAIIDALMDANGEIVLGENYQYINPQKDPSHKGEGELADDLIWHCLWSMDTSAYREEEGHLAKPINPHYIDMNLESFTAFTSVDFTRSWFATTGVTASIFMLKESEIWDYGWEMPNDEMMFFENEKEYQRFIEQILGRARRLARDLHFMQSFEVTTTILTKNRTEGIMHCLGGNATMNDYGDLVAVYRDLSVSNKNFQQIFHKIYNLSWPVETIYKFIQMVKAIASREYCIHSNSGVVCLPNRGITLACEQQLEILKRVGRE